MKTRRTIALCAVAIAAACSGCSDQGAVKPEAAATPAARAVPPLVSARADGTASLGVPPVPEGAGTGPAALTWTVPAGWIAQTPASSMRRAQYRVPGAAGDGECVVFYFGPGQGGDPVSNAKRWAEQFTSADGTSANESTKTSTIDVSGLQVFVVEVAGTYKGGMTMNAAPTVAKPGYRLLGAVAPGPDANWYFKLTGPDRTVLEQKDAFTSMVRSMKHGAS